MKPKSKVLAFFAASLLAGATLLAQGSGTTKPAAKSTYQTVHHVNGVVTARSDGAITVRLGKKSRQFKLTKSTRFVGTKAAKGAKIKVSYRSNEPRVAVEVRHRG